ncbi:hypothetical protein N7528_000861 [Penicillium herquei]|nr:hypothetical protein N7528_000861 [Penicillium herquei]
MFETEEESKQEEEVAAEVEQAAQDEPVEESTKETVLTPEVLTAGVAAAAAATGVAAIAAVHHSHENAAKETESESPAAEAQPEDCKPLLPIPSHNASVPSLEADPVLAALAGDGEALLHRLNQPSTDKLTAATTAQSSTADDKKAQAVPETQPTAESSKQPEATPNTLEPTPGTSANNDGNEDARPTSQSRSVTALSMNNAPDNWLKVLLRTVFKSIGRIIRPWSWGKQ